MSITDFFTQADLTVLTISGIFFGIYFGIHFSLFTTVGDLKKIREKALINLHADKFPFDPLLFIDTVRSESYVLALEPVRKIKYLNYSLYSFAFVSFLTIEHWFFSSLTRIMPDKEVMLYLYSGLLVLAVFYLCREVKFFREYQKLEKKFFK